MTQTLRDKIAEAVHDAIDNVHDMDVTFDDYAQASADAILSVIAESVEPLVWSQWGLEWDANNPVGGTFTVKIDGHSGFYLYTREGVKATDFLEMVKDRSTPDDCMAQAFLIVQRRILSALGLSTPEQEKGE